MSFDHDKDQWTTVQRPRRKRHRLAGEHDSGSPCTIPSTNHTNKTTKHPHHGDTKRQRKNDPVLYEPCEPDVKLITLQLLQHMHTTADGTTTAVHSSTSSSLPTRIKEPSPCKSVDICGASWYKVSHNKHVKIARQLGDVAQVMILACTPSDCRAAKNVRARFKRADRALAAGVGGLF